MASCKSTFKWRKVNPLSDKPELRLDIDPNTVTKVGKFVYAGGDLRPNHGLWGSTRAQGVIAVLDIPGMKWSFIELEGYSPRNKQLFACLKDDEIYCLLKVNKPDEVEKQLKLWRFDLVEEEMSEIHAKGESPNLKRCFSCNYLDEQKRFVVFGVHALHGQESCNAVSLLESLSTWKSPRVKGTAPKLLQPYSTWVHESAIYYLAKKALDIHHDQLFLLRLGINDVVTWSNPQPQTHAWLRGFPRFALLQLQVNYLIFGGYHHSNSHGELSLYDPGASRQSDNQTSFKLCCAPVFAMHAGGFGLLDLTGALYVVEEIANDMEKSQGNI